MTRRTIPLLLLLAVLAGACGGSRPPRGAQNAGIPAALLREMRPIGRGPRFQPPARGPVVGACRRALGPRFGVHVEVFAANRVVIIPAGIGTGPPGRVRAGGTISARCYGPLVTLQPTGIVLVRRGTRPTVGQLFRAWGEPLSATRLASFSGGHVRAYLNGRPSTRAAGAIALTPHTEIVLEIGPYVPPHSRFTFPPGI